MACSLRFPHKQQQQKNILRSEVESKLEKGRVKCQRGKWDSRKQNGSENGKLWWINRFDKEWLDKAVGNENLQQSQQIWLSATLWVGGKCWLKKQRWKGTRKSMSGVGDEWKKTINKFIINSLRWQWEMHKLPIAPNNWGNNVYLTLIWNMKWVEPEDKLEIWRDRLQGTRKEMELKQIEIEGAQLAKTRLEIG